MPSPPKHFQVTHGAQTFYATAIPVQNGRGRLTLGGRKQGCVVIEVLQQQSPRKKLEGALHVSYDPQCNVRGDLARGTGTVTMMRTAIALAFREFPIMDRIYLHDWSTIHCGNMEVYLPALQLTLYGQTWYERKLGVEWDVPHERQYIEAYVAHVTAPCTFLDMWKDIQGAFAREDRASWHERLHAVWKEHGCKCPRDLVAALKQTGRCGMFAPWLGSYFNKHTGPLLLQEVDFYLAREDFQEAAGIVAVTIDHNPYAHEIEARASRQQRSLDVLGAFVPRASHAKTTEGGTAGNGTRCTFGCTPVSEDEWDDLVRAGAW